MPQAYSVRAMVDIFKGFLLLRLLGLLALVVVVAAVFGVVSLTRGSDAAGAGLLAGAVVLSVAAGVFARRARGHRR